MDESIISPAPAHIFPSRNVFDEDAYILLHPDVAAALAEGIVGSGWQHFEQHGFKEGRRWIAKPDALSGVSREISPSDEMLFGNEQHYFDVGASALHCIEAALFAAGRTKSGIRAILDLPCGHGRVMRFLRKAFPEARLTACDLNGDGVDYCAKTFGAIPVLSRPDIDEIPLSEKYDLIWCGSLLTHFPAEKCLAFIRLFGRLLEPGGILVFTTHGRGCEQSLVTGKNLHGLTAEQITPLLRDYRKTGFGYINYSRQTDYGFSLSHPSYVTSHFIQTGDYRLLSYHEQGWDKRQDVVSLQKNFIG